MTDLEETTEEISWFPTIDYAACLAEQDCLNFCAHDVYAWDEVMARVIVIRPKNSVVGCDGCAKICPAGAITFPTSFAARRETLRKLRGPLGGDSDG